MPGDMFGTDAEQAEEPCCCDMAGKQTEVLQDPPSTSEPWVLGALDAPVGTVPKVDTRLRLADHLASLVGPGARTKSMLFWRHISGYNRGEGL